MADGHGRAGLRAQRRRRDSPPTPARGARIPLARRWHWRQADARKGELSAVSRRAGRRTRSPSRLVAHPGPWPAAVPPRAAAGPAQVAPLPLAFDRTTWALAIAVAAAGVVFMGALGHGFVWDDHLHLARNPHLAPPTWAGLRALWTGPHENLYSPVVYTAWAGLSLLARGDAGLSPLPFHAAVIALHALNGVACCLLLRRLVGDPWAAAAGALLFALHPLQVEPVAWASGLKDVLCASLSLGALLLLVGKGQPAPSRAAFAGATVLYALALLTKPSAVALPVLALAIEGLALRRPRARLITTFAVWALLALPMLLVTRQVQPLPPVVSEVPLLGRVVVALDAVAFYLGKLAWPLSLTTDYGRKPVRVLSDPATIATVAIALAAMIGGWWAARRRPLIGAAGLLFVGALLPVLGLLPFVFQCVSTVADRYCYLALLGPALAAAVLLRGRRRLAYLGAGAVLALLAARTALHVPVWTDDLTLHGHARRHNPDSFTAHMVLAETLDRAGRLAEATPYARRAVALEPYGSSWFLLGSLLGQQDQLREGELYLRMALEARPHDGFVHYNMGLLYKRLGKRERAIEHFQAAQDLTPPLEDRAAWQLGELHHAEELTVR
jgi:protein O-mannosyl-transferase